MKFVYNYLLKIYNYLIFYKYKRRINDLIRRGLKIGKNVTIEPTVMIDTNYPYLIEIGDNCSLAQGVKLLPHDATTFKFLKEHTRLGKIVIKDNVFVGTNVIILSGVTIGPNVLVAAGSVINKDIPENSCVAGVPARFYKKFDDYLSELQNEINNSIVLNCEEVHINTNSHQNVVKRNKMVLEAIEKGAVFVKGQRRSYKYTLNG